MILISIMIKDLEAIQCVRKHCLMIPIYVDFFAIIVFIVVFWIVTVMLHNRTLPKRL